MSLLVDSPIASLLAELGGVEAHFQPLADLTTGKPVAYEALARFGGGAPPCAAFEKAWRQGAGPELEAAALRAALRHGPMPGGVALAVNVTPSALAHPALRAALPDDLGGLIVEVTENELVTSESATGAALARLRERGARIAVDDAGAGYASLRQVLVLGPDIIKLDRTLVRGVHEDAAKAALVRALVTLGRDLGAQVCAEGIEELEELLALADLDVELGQGYLLGRPAATCGPTDALAASACRLSQRAALSTPADAGETIETVSRALAACASPGDLEDCVAAIERLLGVEEISVSRVVAGGHGLVACAGPRWTPEPIYRLADFPATARALATGEAIQVLAGDTLADPSERDLLAAHGYGAMLLIPLLRHGEPVGTLEVYRRDPRAWSRRQIVRARTVAHQLALAL